MTNHPRTGWTAAERAEFVAWHESVIAQYPSAVQAELRDVRERWMAGIKTRPPESKSDVHP
jgi:hypothetical protein